MSFKIFLNGANGRMGQAISNSAPAQDSIIQVAADVDNPQLDQIASCDAVIEFSFHSATIPVLEKALESNTPVVIGTTGHTPEEKARIHEISKSLPIVWAGNYSVGVNLLFYYTEKVAEKLGNEYHPEIIEMHHALKKDAPSGTAEDLVSAVLRGRGWDESKVVHGRTGITGERPAEEVAVHALRGGEVVGDHTVIFAGPGERFELTHKASDRRIFSQGAIRAAQWVAKQPAGLYNMQNVLGLE